MDHPESVIGASYHNQTESRPYENYDQNLYEYNNSKGLTDRVCDYVADKLNNNQQQHQVSNRMLLVPKAFYFFFFAAFGSLFPLMAIYFKQMAMSPTQVGILFGFRPFVEFLSVPFWAQYAEKWRRGKTILLLSISCWIFFTLVVGFIQPPVHSCLMHNETHIFFEKKGISFSNLKPGGAINNHNLSNGRVMNKRQFENQNEFIQTYADLVLKRKKRQQRNFRGRLSTFTQSTLTSTSNTEELEFALSTIKPVQVAIDQVKSDLTGEILQDSSKIYNETKKAVDQSVEKTVNNLVKTTLRETTSKLTSKPTEHTISHTTKSSKSLFNAKANQFLSIINFDLLNSRPSAKQNYFDSSPLDSSRVKGKIVYLNDSALKLIKPSLKTSIVYQKQDVDRIFLVFLFFILAGEFFSAPAITMADTCTLQYLGPAQADLYGRQRMFGSLGWGVAMFSIGFLLDNAHKFTDHPCGMAGPDERNYTVCFTIYSILMGVALIVATQFQFQYGDDEQIPLKSISSKIKSTVNQVRGSKYQQFDRKLLVNESDDEQPPEAFANEQPQLQDQQQSTNQNDQFVIKETSKQKYQRLFRLCSTIKHLVFLFMVWFMGIGVGLVFTFLFWHLQDLGGSPFLYGIASVANHISELIAYFFVHDIVAKYGHVKIFYAGLVGNTVRFVYVSLITEPYWILPFEFIQGITHALVWAAATSYFAQSVPKDLRGNAQGLLQGLHFGLGRGCGAVLGGIIISSFGARLTFFLYGMCCLVTFILTVGVSQFNMDIANIQSNVDERSYVDEKTPEDSVANVVNPLMNDTNYYYQSSNTNQDPNRTPVKLFVSPHGVPSTNPNWTRQFKNT